MTAAADKSKPFFPLAGLAQDGYSNENEATATCFCGAVQLAFSTKAVVNTFVCNCYDCHKITASMFASNFTVADENIKWLRGRENLKTFSQKKTIASGKAMTNFFCTTCGALMNRVGDDYPGLNFLRIGSVDDFSLHDTLLKPQMELFTKDRTSWVHSPEVEGIQKKKAMKA